jgi:hypothetical protein
MESSDGVRVSVECETTTTETQRERFSFLDQTAKPLRFLLKTEFLLTSGNRFIGKNEREHGSR